MDFAGLQRTVKEHIANDQLKEALQLLVIDAGETYNRELEDAASQLSGRLRALNDQINGGTVSYEDAGLERNRISQAILDFLGKLEQFYDVYALQAPLSGTQKLRELVRGLRSNQLLLAHDNPTFTSDLAFIFDEIEKTYASILSALTQYISPAFDPVLPAATYVNFERGGLYNEIQQSRGHCTLIFDHYVRGLRDYLEQKMSDDRDTFEAVDQIFMNLAHADYSVFDQMSGIGYFVQQESAALLELLAEGKVAEAKTKLLGDRKKLKPLESSLMQGIQEIKELKLRLEQQV